ncbi:MAG: CoA pyrophosphatase [Firmicutes bacterium]|nr:CoA pyrophosphatase [Bacillota bacterium]
MNISKIEKFMENRAPGDIGKRKNCSVLIPLVEIDGKLHILYEQRSTKIKTQPGDVCFPGGVMEKGETPIECALRETEEEIGIAQDKIRVLGQFDSLFEVRNITMHTVIGVIEQESLAELHINPDEVATVFTVPYEFFENREPLIYEHDVIQKVDDFPYEETGINPNYKWRVGKAQIPIMHYPSKDAEGSQLIWGLTCNITLWLKDKLKEYYQD